jgi:DnaB-like helicase N terminal domain/AAA domain
VSNTLPAAIEVERLVLGAAMFDASSMSDLRMTVQREDFSIETHRRIWAACCDLSDQGMAVDRVTVAEALQQRGQLTAVGGLSYLVDLDLGLKIVNLQSYVSVLKERSARRRVLVACTGLEKRALNGEPIANVVESGLRIFSAIDVGFQSGSKAIRSVDEIPMLRDCSASEVLYLVEPVLAEGIVTALTGDSGSGKSSLALAWCGLALRSERPVLILDRENPLAVIQERIVRLHIDDGPCLRYWGGWLDQQAPTPGSPLVLDWVRQCKQSPIVVIDSLIAFHGGDENDAAETRAFMHQLRRLSDLGAAVLITHHDGKADTAKDYRGSSDIKASVDIGFHVSNVSESGHLETLRLRCFKHRFGFVGEVIYRYRDGRFEKDERSGVHSPRAASALLSILRQAPGIGIVEFEARAAERGLKRARARAWLDGAERSGIVRVESGPKNRRELYLDSGGKDEL